MNLAQTTIQARFAKQICLIVLTGSLLIWAGCQKSSAIARKDRSRAAAQPAQDHLSRALEYLEKIDEFEEQSAHQQIAFQLNRWLDAQKADINWQPDEMVNRLPRSVRDHGVIEELSKQRFSVEDVRAIQESVWMRQLAQWVSKQPIDPLFAKWLDRQKPQLGELGTEQLGTAYRLFDWIVRNIQLDQPLPNPDESTSAPAAGTGDTKGSVAAVQPAAIRGIPGPGYHFEPSQNLLYGHGDVWQRMRLLTLLARQQGFDVVTLAFPGRSIPPRPRPWVSGVLVGDQLYLLDMSLGIPIPSKNWEGIATLAEVVADPSLLKQLEIDEKHTYSIASEDLAEVVALIDVVGANLSQRTQMVEKQLVGEHRTVLAVPVSRLAGRLRACRGVSDVYLWSVPFEANWFRQVVEQKLRNDPTAAAQYALEYSMFLNRTPLARGRIVYLRGEIENRDEQLGAKALLLQARVPQQNLDDLANDEEVQQQLGLVRNPRLNEQQWLMQVEVFKTVLTRSKQHASLWLGLCQLESGRPDAAIEWLQTRTLEPWPDGPWAPLARYDLARAYEAQGNLAEGQRLLLADKSLQEHGNYLRARLLEAQLATAEKPAAITPGPGTP